MDRSLPGSIINSWFFRKSPSWENLGECWRCCVKIISVCSIVAPAPKLFFHLFHPKTGRVTLDHKRHPATVKRGEGVGTIGSRLEAEKIRVLPVLGIRLGIRTEINNR